MELSSCQIRIGFLPIKVLFSIRWIFPPISIVPSYCKISLRFKRQNHTCWHLLWIWSSDTILLYPVPPLDQISTLWGCILLTEGSLIRCNNSFLILYIYTCISIKQYKRLILLFFPLPWHWHLSFLARSPPNLKIILAFLAV